MIHISETRMRLPLGMENVFCVFCDARNLERITLPEKRFRMTTPQPVCIQQGALIDYQLRPYCAPFLRMRLKSLSSCSFTVEQLLSDPTSRRLATTVLYAVAPSSSAFVNHLLFS